MKKFVVLGLVALFVFVGVALGIARNRQETVTASPLFAITLNRATDSGPKVLQKAIPVASDDGEGEEGPLTLFPRQETRCPLFTICNSTRITYCRGWLPTRCLVQATACPEEPTKCPEVETACPAFVTTCPEEPEETVCPATETTCQDLETVCPVDITTCPEQVETQCPLNPTTCPNTQTTCADLDTICPVDETNCPAVDTVCVTELTICPPNETTCPLVDTECPIVSTVCPEVGPTTCSGDTTTCPVTPTACDTTSTTCGLTQCDEQWTICHTVAGDTWCPYVDTECPLNPLPPECQD